MDYTVTICTKSPETRAVHRDVMSFPIQTNLENWISFRVGATLPTLRPRRQWSVCNDGPLPAGTAAMQLAFRVPLGAVDQYHAELGWRRRALFFRGPEDNIIEVHSEF